MENDEAGGFTIAVVTGTHPVEVSFQEFELPIIPDDLFDMRHSPREYGFDTDLADVQLRGEGYEMTTYWQWTGSNWGAVVQLREKR